MEYQEYIHLIYTDFEENFSLERNEIELLPILRKKWKGLLKDNVTSIKLENQKKHQTEYHWSIKIGFIHEKSMKIVNLYFDDVNSIFDDLFKENYADSHQQEFPEKIIQLFLTEISMIKNEIADSIFIETYSILMQQKYELFHEKLSETIKKQENEISFIKEKQEYKLQLLYSCLLEATEDTFKKINGKDFFKRKTIALLKETKLNQDPKETEWQWISDNYNNCSIDVRYTIESAILDVFHSLEEKQKFILLIRNIGINKMFEDFFSYEKPPKNFEELTKFLSIDELILDICEQIRAEVNYKFN